MPRQNYYFMKKTALIVIASGLCFTALAQTELPEQLLNAPVKDWQLNGLTLLVVVQLLGRAYSALKSGGGLKGIWNGIVYGTNTPNP